MSSFTILPSHSVAIVGRRGSGKSTLANVLVGGYRSLVVIDPKHTVNIPYCTVVYSFEEFRQVFPQRSRRVIFRPDPSTGDPEGVNLVLGRVLAYGNTAVDVDEAADYATSTSILPNYRRAIVTGRDLGARGSVPTVNVTQRPRACSNFVLSEADHLFVFDLALQSDRDKVAEIGGDELRDRRLEGTHGFWYVGPATGGRPVLCPPLELPRQAAPVTAPEVSANGSADDRQPVHGDAARDRGDLRRQVGRAGVPGPRAF